MSRCRLADRWAVCTGLRKPGWNATMNRKVEVCAGQGGRDHPRVVGGRERRDEGARRSPTTRRPGRCRPGGRCRRRSRARRGGARGRCCPRWSASSRRGRGSRRGGWRGRRGWAAASRRRGASGDTGRLPQVEPRADEVAEAVGLLERRPEAARTTPATPSASRARELLGHVLVAAHERPAVERRRCPAGGPSACVRPRRASAARSRATTSTSTSDVDLAALGRGPPAQAGQHLEERLPGAVADDEAVAVASRPGRRRRRSCRSPTPGGRGDRRAAGRTPTDHRVVLARVVERRRWWRRRGRPGGTPRRAGCARRRSGGRRTRARTGAVDVATVQPRRSPERRWSDAATLAAYTGVDAEGSTALKIRRRAGRGGEGGRHDERVLPGGVERAAPRRRTRSPRPPDRRGGARRRSRSPAGRRSVVVVRGTDVVRRSGRVGRPRRARRSWPGTVTPQIRLDNSCFPIIVKP